MEVINNLPENTVGKNLGKAKKFMLNQLRIENLINSLLVWLEHNFLLCREARLFTFTQDLLNKNKLMFCSGVKNPFVKG